MTAGLHIQDLTAASDHSRRIRTRDTADIDAAVLHQMGFARSGGPERFLRTKSHYIVLQDGRVAQLHRDQDYLYASNALNSRSIAIEFEGNMPSERGRFYKPERFGRHRVTMAQVSAGRRLLLHLRDVSGIRFVFAHRQGTNGHTNCCGPDLWFNVGQWAIANGFSDGGVGFTMGDGLPIPNAWRNHGYMVFTLAEAEGVGP
ncbi:MAG: N-acetylmuramoyl-L-alanine amidase [Pseudomonadota bacterium]